MSLISHWVVSFSVASSKEWSSWSPCSVTCGMGQQERSRDCGSACREMETQACYRKRCSGTTTSTVEENWKFYNNIISCTTCILIGIYNEHYVLLSLVADDAFRRKNKLDWEYENIIPDSTRQPKDFINPGEILIVKTNNTASLPVFVFLLFD